MTAGDPDQALYAISVAGELTGRRPPDAADLREPRPARPGRTGGGTRRYSGRDIERIKRITTFLAAGLNLAGIAQVFALEAETQRLREEVEDLRSRPHRDS